MEIKSKEGPHCVRRPGNPLSLTKVAHRESACPVFSRATKSCFSERPICTTHIHLTLRFFLARSFPEIQQHIKPLDTNALKTHKTKSSVKMARRFINKAYNDLVGAEGSINIGSELPKNQSVLKLPPKDVTYGVRQAAETKPEGGQPKRAPPVAHPGLRDSAPAKDKGERTHFINIDGEGNAQPVQQKEKKVVAETAYKMRSFMSAVDLSPRGRFLAQVNPNVAKRPTPRPDTRKAFNPPEDPRMYLPKGIQNTGQPYVAPKFMPSFREMMAPKPKTDPLVSIIERTPPSLQKWAVEWNAEPKKTISVDELKADLVREAGEKPPKPPGTYPGTPVYQENNHAEIKEQETPEKPTHQNRTASAEPFKNPFINAMVNRFTPPWKDCKIPLSQTAEPQELRDTRKIGKPLVDWRPPKYCGQNTAYTDRQNEYSFKDAVTKGTPVIPKPNGNAGTKPFVSKLVGNTVYFDSEQQKFHEWFKTRMSAAVNSAVSHPQTKKDRIRKTESYADASIKSQSANEPSSINQRRPEQPNPSRLTAQAERIRIDDVKQIGANGLTPREVEDNPPKADPKNTNPPTRYEMERNSSFCRWLKLRGHHIVKNDQSPQENKKGKEQPQQNNHNPQFPWSVSYTLRKKISPTILPKRPVSMKSFKRPHKTVSQEKSQRPETYEKSPETVTPGKKKPASEGTPFVRGGVLKSSRKAATPKKEKTPTKKAESARNPEQNSMRTETKKINANRKQSAKSMKSADKKPSNAGKSPVKGSPKSRENVESKLPISSDHLWLNDSWHVDSEMDHINHMRKMEMYRRQTKVASTKNNLLPAGAPQMKYWESKYTKNPGSGQSQKEAIFDEQYGWLQPRLAVDNGNKVKEADGPEAGAGGAQAVSFATVPSFTSTLCKDRNKRERSADRGWAPVMDFAKDFDVDRFLHKEESVEKELLEMGKREYKNDGGDIAVNEESTKPKGKEQIRFPRMVQVRTEADGQSSLRQKVEQKLEEDEFLKALGENPGLEDLEWSEFIGPRNSIDVDQDSDLGKLMGSQARQLGSARNSCL